MATIDRNNIITDEVRLAASECLLEANSAATDLERRAALLTYSALIRFNRSFDAASPEEVPSVRPRQSYYEDETKIKSLRSILKESGILYFGPMFIQQDQSAPLQERKTILREMRAGGFLVEPLRHLTDIQLDMFFTKTIETGIIRRLTAEIPRAQETTNV